MEGIGNFTDFGRKIIPRERAVLEAVRLHHSGKKVVTTNGCFDILHVGHARNLAFARSLGDALFVGINTDASVRANKGPNRPIVPEQERAEMIASLAHVDFVFLFDEENPISWLSQIRPHFHVKGSDRSLDQIVEREIVETYGGEIVLFPHTQVHSSTRIIEEMQNKI